jgi:hypothetical protein
VDLFLQLFPPAEAIEFMQANDTQVRRPFHLPDWVIDRYHCT